MTVIPLAALETPMEFENLRDAVIAVFVENEQGLYQTIDKQEQSRSSEQMKGTLRTIQVFVQSTNPEHSSQTEFENEVTFGLFLRVAEPSKGDVATLDSPTATPTEKQAALLAIDLGTKRADLSYDALLRIATRVIMSPLNLDLGMDEFTVSNRILKTARKDAPVDHGNLIVLTGSAFITASVTEIMDGATPVAAVQDAIRIDSEFHTPGEDPDDLTPALTRTDIDTSA